MKNRSGHDGAHVRRTLLMLHGGGPGVDAASNWHPVIGTLSRLFDCVVPDLAGFGNRIGDTPAALPEGPAQWARLRATQVRTLMDERSLDQVVLLGNSAAGGAAALALMALAPDRIERAVVMGGAGSGALPPTVPFYDLPTRAEMRATLARLVADEHAHEALIDELTEERFERALAPGAETAFRSMFRPDPDPALRVDLPAIRQPVLALHGELDRVSPLGVSQRLVEKLPHGELRTVEGAGHWIHVDRPQRFCELIAEFLT